MNLFNNFELENNGKSILPETFKLSALYPNPFNSIEKIEYSLHYTSAVSHIYNLLGRKLETLHSDLQ